TVGGSPAVSSVILGTSTSAAISVYERVLLATQAAIQGLTLAGLPSDQVYVTWDDEAAEQQITLPAVVLSIVGQSEEEEPFSTEQAGVVYPVKITLRNRVSAAYQAAISQTLLWRQQIMRALRQHGDDFDPIPETWKTEVRAAPVAHFDPRKHQ